MMNIYEFLKMSLNLCLCLFMSTNGLFVFCARCATCALDISMRNICARFFPNAQDLRKIVVISPMRKIVVISSICARLYLFPQCAIYAQDLRKILSQCAIYAQDCTSFSNAQYMRKICARLYFFPQCAIYAQDLRKIVVIFPMCKIVVISSMRNICARFVQNCTYFLNAQYMRKICARLHLFPQCAIYAQDCTSFSNAQYMRKICARLYLFLQCAIYAQDCSYFSNAQYMHKICARLYLTSNLKW